MKQEIGFLTYLSQLEKTPILTAKQEKELAVLAQAGNKRAKNKLVAANLKLVVKIAASFLYKGLPFQDLIEEGNLGLIRAVEKFDPKRGYRFTTYARWWIMSYIRRALRSSVSTIRLSASLIDIISRWKKISVRLAQQLGREPYYDEIIDELKPSPYFLRILKRFLRSDYSKKQNVFPGVVSGDFKDISDKESLPADINLLDEADKKLIKKLLSTISEKEAQILSMRYGLDHNKPPLTLRQMAKKLKMSGERIRQIEEKALKKLHHVYLFPK
ncbi:MAG: RNA polymerase sigma factor RpoD/SigA [Planctomycetes bacterium]|nr:RNA polymerase sigma factor RpoD/SigA [Planctomycetota bacterium]